MKWLRMRFKSSIKVFVPVDDQCRPIEENGLIRFVYQLKPDAASYTTKRSALSYIEGAMPEDMPEDAVSLNPATSKKKNKKKETTSVTELPPLPAPDATLPPGTIVVYTDGGCSPNPGPGGLGIYMVFGAHTLEIWEYYAHATNNFCELTAILHALQQIRNKSLPVLLYSDSTYAIGVSSGAMTAKKNVELVQEIREEVAKFTNLHLLKVKAHAGIRHNEHVDKLCELARNTRENGMRRTNTAQHAES